MVKLRLIIVFVCICLRGVAQQAVSAHEHPGVTFTENAGQWENNILFKATLDGGALFLENDKLVFNFYDKYKSRKFHFNHIHPGSLIDDIIKGHAYAVVFEGCNRVNTIDKYQKGKYYENYFVGSDDSKWKGEVSNYHQLFYRELYHQIDYEILTAVTNIKYNFHVKPGGNPDDIKLHYEGIENIQINKGVLVIKPNANEVFEQKPYAYQVINGITKVVPCNFLLINNTISYEFPKGYNKKHELVIDPLLVFAAQSGSTADNFGMTATFDSQGNLYSGGTIFDIGYPVTLGAYSSSFFGPAYYGNTDVVITKYNSTGTNLLYSTYFGGNKTESINSLIVDHNDNLCFYGVTSSNNFPTGIGAYDKTYNGGQFIMFVNNGLRFNSGTDIYVSKFNSTGTSLLASTYIGGSGNDGLNHTDAANFYPVPVPPPGTGSQVVAEPKYDSLQHNYGDQSRGEIQVDAQNNIYVASSTRSTNFPAVNGFDNSLNGKQDGVIMKFNSSLSNLLSSSFIGGSSTDAGYGLVIDNNSDIYVTGGTTSNDLPFAVNGYQTSYQGGNADGYVLRINSAGNTVLNGTYYGTPNYDQSYFIQSDKQNNIYIYGQSLGDMPVIKAASSATVFNVPKTHQFISRFDKTLNILNMSMVFGHDTVSTDISPSAFSVDKCSNIYLSGWGSSLFVAPSMSNMPLLSPTQSTTDGSDFYFMGLDSCAAALKYGSYFGGSLSREHVDGGTSRFDPLGKIYQSVCAGCNGNDDFPVTPGAWPCLTPGDCPPGPNLSSNCNNGVIKVDFELLVAVATINTNTLSGCAPVTVNYMNASPGLSYLWYLTNTDTTSTIPNPIVTYTNPGTYSVSLVVYNPASCNIKDSVVTFVTVYENPVAAFTSTSSPCSNTITTTNNSTGSLGANSYLWNWGDSTPTSTLTAPSHTYNLNGTYTLSLTLTSIEGCKATATETVSVFTYTPTALSSTICAGNTANLNALGGTSYTWEPASMVSNINIPNPTTSPSVTTIFTVQIGNSSSGIFCSQTLTTQVIVNPDNSPDFNFSVFPCTDSVIFRNTSTTTAPSQTISWSFGGGQPGSNSDTITQVYANGNYSVTLVATNNFGCKDSIMKSFNVFNFMPVAAMGGSICLGYTRTLLADGGTSYSWSPASLVSNSLIATPITTPSTTTIYSVTIENNTSGVSCVRTLTTSVFVFPAITSLFSYTIGACNNDVQFADMSGSLPVSWDWNFGDANFSSVQNPLHFYTSSGTYTASLIVANASDCKDTSTQIITLPFFSPISVNASISKCESDSVQLNATGGDYYLWSPATSLSNSTIANPMASPAITTIYTVTIGNVNGTDSCESAITTTVAINPFSYNTALINVSASTITLGQSSTVTLNGFSFNGSITIVPPTNSSVISQTIIIITPKKSGEYTVYYTEPGGCRYTLKTIYVEVISDECNEGVVYLPTGFTPNDDGANDILFIRSNFITEVYLTIYDRWGEKLFETNDVAKGWDGTYKGKKLDQGVYGYYMTFKCNNGQESFKKGNITLMR
ncbi:MAG: PKD domain-containing protein [Bacteroidota bacterium]